MSLVRILTNIENTTLFKVCYKFAWIIDDSFRIYRVDYNKKVIRHLDDKIDKIDIDIENTKHTLRKQLDIRENLVNERLHAEDYFHYRGDERKWCHFQNNIYDTEA
jgi:hypothetical protein